MGDPRRLKKKYSTPRDPWNEAALREELQILGEYGLRNKRELWKARSILRGFRRSARLYMALGGEEKEKRVSELINRLYRLGLVSENATLDEVLSLTVHDILERRLQTIVYRKGLAPSIYSARQLIVHGKVLVGDRRVTIPSYLVLREEEPLIKLRESAKKAKEEAA
ncbi:MAG TPA: 30S ribosomal protein S4 [Candidatus Bathyarchaeota archaeon]|nr:30S ribosomal protein S4 [Candidatus Bathyarchaeota archaeon]